MSLKILGLYFQRLLFHFLPQEFLVPKFRTLFSKTFIKNIFGGYLNIGAKTSMKM